MENKKLSKEYIEGIIEQLKTKQNNLRAVAALVPMFESCIKDYDMLIAQVESMREPTVKATEKPSESSKN